MQIDRPLDDGSDALAEAAALGPRKRRVSRQIPARSKAISSAGWISGELPLQVV